MTIPSPQPACSGSSLGLLLRQTRDALWGRMQFELAAAGHELNLTQFITLKALVNGSAGVTDLARIADLNPGAMTRLLDKLEARQLIQRTHNPNDRRALDIHLTERGQQMWRDIDQCGQRVLERAFFSMDDSHQQQLMQLLAQVRDNLQLKD